MMRLRTKKAVFESIEEGQYEVAAFERYTHFEMGLVP